MVQNKDVLRLQAYPDATAPHGWRAESGAFYRPDWGDRLVEENGQHYIEIEQILGEVNSSIQPHTISKNLVEQFWHVLQSHTNQR